MTRAVRRHARSLTAAGAVALVVALTPLAWIALEVGGEPVPSAFADAPAGSYAVLAREEAGVSVIMVVGSGDEPFAAEVARVVHLPGHAPRGTVSPDGLSVAILVPDGGTPADPQASLLSVALETGAVQRLADGLDPLQDPLWTSAGDALVVTRPVDGGSGIAALQVDLAGGPERELARVDGALALAPVGFDGDGRLLAIVIDGRGSTVIAGAEQLRTISPYVTRDWELSPDGTALAFIEANLDEGLRYLPNVVSLTDDGSTALAQGVDTGQALGVAWRPGGDGIAFGYAGAARPGTGVSAQGLAGGFDVPLAFSGDGDLLAVQRWSGTGIDDPGDVQLQLVRDGERQPLIGYTRFFGWASR